VNELKNIINESLHIYVFMSVLLGDEYC